jgi:hypothetical protein
VVGDARGLVGRDLLAMVRPQVPLVNVSCHRFIEGRV